MVSGWASHFVLLSTVVSNYVAGAESSVVRLSHLSLAFPHDLGYHSSSPFRTGLASIFVSYVSHKASTSNLPHAQFSQSHHPLIRFRSVIGLLLEFTG